MIIGACGYCATGSSVLTDLLREYNDIQVFDDFEFILAYKVDGLQDLEFHLMKQNSKNISGDFAIKRFLKSSKCYLTPFINKPISGKEYYKLSKNYIEKITQIKYKGVESADMYTGNVLRNIFAFFSKKIFIPKFLEKIAKKRVYIWPCRDLYYSIKPDNFYDESKKYINSILKEMGADLSKPICLDQPFEGNNPEQSFPFFENPVAIVIDRDPRDLWMEYKYSMHPDCKFVPNNVDDFIIFYKNMRCNNSTGDNIYRINFEEFIYDYDNTKKKIEKILGIKEHLYPNLYFKPSLSINNTQKFLKHPEDSVEIKKIEKELSEFLFDFNKYPNLKPNGRGFTGDGKKMLVDKE